jgi:hypothetical protein
MSTSSVPSSLPLPLRLLAGGLLSRRFSARRAVRAECPQRRDYLLLAAGLKAVLARCKPRGIERDFPASAQALRALRSQLLWSGQIALPAHLLNDLAHEIALHADAATRAAARRCLQRATAG